MMVVLGPMSPNWEAIRSADEAQQKDANRSRPAPGRAQEIVPVNLLALEHPPAPPPITTPISPRSGSGAAKSPASVKASTVAAMAMQSARDMRLRDRGRGIIPRGRSAVSRRRCGS